jgi:hypothetical protein
MERLVEASMRRGTLGNRASGDGLRARRRGRGAGDAFARGNDIGAGGRLAAEPVGPGDDELDDPDDGSARPAPAAPVPVRQPAAAQVPGRPDRLGDRGAV